MNIKHLSIKLSLILSAMYLLTASVVADEAKSNASDKEKELIAVLQSDAPESEKAITCKLLAIHGSAEAVPELAKLLSNPKLSSWSRIALEVIPGEEADKALRDAAGSLDGRLLIGMLNSIGVRKDEGAVELLAGKLDAKDEEAASAAAVALGHIGNPAATEILRKSLASASDNVRSAVAEGCILCAEQYLASNQPEEAVKIYDEVRKTNLPKQRILEATRGAILARNDSGIPMLLELYQSPDKEMFELALSLTREYPGGKVDQSLAKELSQAEPDRAALMIQAMADRKETVVLSAILASANDGPVKVRNSAIKALANVGDISCLADLLEIGIESDQELSTSARETLAVLPGQNVDEQIIKSLDNTEGKKYPLLLELVGKRRISAHPALLKALKSSDPVVRQAALISLGETVTYQELPVLISEVVSPSHQEDIPVAQKALKIASVRMPDREACAVTLTDAFDKTDSPETKVALLKILGAVSGTKALTTIQEAAKSNEDYLQDTSTRILGEWMTIDAAPVLLDIAKSVSADKYKIRALRGYIRIARQFRIPPVERIKMCENAYDEAQRTEEKKLIIEILKRYPNARSLKLAIRILDNPDLNQEATEAVKSISDQLAGKDIDLKRMLSNLAMEKVKLEIVKAEYGKDSQTKDVTEVIREKAGNSPIILLNSSSYNTSFGSDPAPGVPKTLTVEYKINDKKGSVTLKENALIILPIPE